MGLHARKKTLTGVSSAIISEVDVDKPNLDMWVVAGSILNFAPPYRGEIPPPSNVPIPPSNLDLD